MPVEIKIDNPGIQELERFFDNVVDAVRTAAHEAALEEAKSIKREWRTRSTSNQVPGNFSDGWKKYKAKLGLHTEHLQRFGRGDKRSYYEQIRVLELRPEGGAVVGVPNSAQAFDIHGKPSGKSLANVAEELEEKFPLWQDIFQSRPPHLKKLLKEKLKERLSALGAKDAN